MSAPAEVGSTANHYQLLARLAVGGMAEIFLARGVSAAGVERYCVLKRILRNRANDMHFVQMFLDEARLAAQLNHPNVAQVYDIGRLGDSYFFAMEYVHGETVRAVLQRARSLRREVPLGAVLTVITGAAAGLQHAHERRGLDGRPLGIVHRDVSPSNLMVSYEGGVKLVDFGVAKAADRAQETRSGTVKGKISYLSPEQCRGVEVDRRTDLFALGIVMWEMVTGERLYRRSSDFENMNAIVNEPTPPPSSRGRVLPPELDELVLRLLSKDPETRFQTAEDVIEAAEQIAASSGAMISTSGLGRLLRDMFGQRPEPWLEVDPQEAPEGVTVTSEPIPPELGASIPDALDLQLSGLPDLSSARALSQNDGVPLPMAPGPSSARQRRVTAPMRTTRSKSSDSSGPAEAPPLPPPPPSKPGELPLPAPPVTLPEVLPNRAYPVSTAEAPALVPGPEVQLRRSGPHLPPAAAPPVRPSAPPAVHGSGGHPPQPVSPQAAIAEEPEKPARGWPMIAVILAAMVIGSLTVLLVMKTGERGGEASADAAVARALAADAAPGPIVTPIDADPEPAVAADATEPVAQVDAAPPDPPKTPLDLAMEERRHADAVAICNKRLTSEIAATCTLAACHAGLEGKARTWFTRAASGERPRLTALCKSLGIDPVPPRRPTPPKTDAGVDKCEQNPMACQH